MRPIAGKIRRDLRRHKRRGVIDVAAVRQAKAFQEEIDQAEMGLAELPSGHVFWMKVLRGLARLAWPLVDAKPFRKLRDRIAESEERFMPGGPPASPLTDSFHVLWCIADAGLGLERETLGSVAAAIGPALGVPDRVIGLWHTLATSHPGVYRIDKRADTIVTLTELVTGVTVQVEIADEIPGDVGTIWWTRLLPPPAEGGSPFWTSIVTPYVFAPGAERAWRDYFDRAVNPASADQRTQAYRRHMKGGTSPFFWLEFIVDAYVGVSGHAVVLTGVPDRIETLPHAEGNEDHRVVTEDPLERVRERLTAFAGAQGLSGRATEAFEEARALVPALEPTGPEHWDPPEQHLLRAFAMYGARDDDGLSALDHLAVDGLESMTLEERRTVDALLEGWFSVFEVVRIKIDEAIELRDIWRRRRFWIKERSATRSVGLRDVLAGWVMKGEDGSYLEGAITHVPRLWAAPVVARLREIMTELRNDRRRSWRARHELLVATVSAVFAGVRATPPMPTLANYDGHPLVLARATYTLRDPSAVIACLGEAPGLEYDEGENKFVLIDETHDVIVARIAVDDHLLVVETNSRERLGTVRTWLEEILTDQLAHRADDFTAPAFEAFGAPPGPEPELDPPPEVRDALAAQLLQRLRAWLDTPVPVLGDKTPRQAIRSARGRDDVSSMLLEQERILRRGPNPPPLDFAPLWTELGLRYPD